MRIPTLMRIARYSLLLAGLAIASCNKTDKTNSVDTTHVVSQAVKVVTIVPASDSAAVYPKVKLQIVSPREGQVIKEVNDSIRVVMMVSGYDLGKRTPGDSAKGIAFSNEGQHVHVIVDDKPYMANYKNGQPFNVGILAPGLHTIRAFPSYSWHESIKSPGAFAARTFYVGEGPKDKKAVAPNDLKKPLLTYSRPKGSYKSGQPILLDFYVTNAKLGAGAYSVAVWIDGKKITTIDAWRPYYIKDLGIGKHTVHLQLLDASGNAVPGSYNSPQQEITVE
jgi:hypothetical protein